MCEVSEGLHRRGRKLSQFKSLAVQLRTLSLECKGFSSLHKKKPLKRIRDKLD